MVHTATTARLAVLIALGAGVAPNADGQPQQQTAERLVSTSTTPDTSGPRAFRPPGNLEFYAFLGPSYSLITVDAVVRDGLRFWSCGRESSYGGRMYVQIVIRDRAGRERLGWVLTSSAAPAAGGEVEDASGGAPPSAPPRCSPGGRAAGTSPTGGVIGGVLAGLPFAPPPPPPPPAARVMGAKGNVEPPRQIRRVDPVYPAIAQSARVQGVVIVEAIIGSDGKVSSARVLRSIPLLDLAALDAVRQWEYAPTLLDGVPIPVVMSVAVQFTLTDPAAPPPQ